LKLLTLVSKALQSSLKKHRKMFKNSRTQIALIRTHSEVLKMFSSLIRSSRTNNNKNLNKFNSLNQKYYKRKIMKLSN
jgi:cytochrome b involved in lipid metabolism